MFALLTRFVLALRSVVEVRASCEAEILVLRQQLLVLNCKSPARRRLRNVDRLMLVWLYWLFPSREGLTCATGDFTLPEIPALTDHQGSISQLPDVLVACNSRIGTGRSSQSHWARGAI